MLKALVRLFQNPARNKLLASRSLRWSNVRPVSDSIASRVL
jgi:hypothetical protein